MSQTTPMAHLRILASSDLHMHVMAFDYRNDAKRPGTGLASLAHLIEHARAECPEALCLLLDNGDLLQGTELADTVAYDPAADPLAECLHHVGYDALGLGNHDFDYGMARLTRHIAALDLPVICSNFDVEGAQPHALLERRVRLSDGRSVPISIGILSVLPQETVIWNAAHLEGSSAPRAPEAAVQEGIAALRAKGADLVVLLAHTGLSESGNVGSENNAQLLARVPGVDALICGHTHLRLPGPDHAGFPDVDIVTGKIVGVPAVMPGYAGAFLGVIDLRLAQEDGSWRLCQAESELRPVHPDTPEVPLIKTAAQRAHNQTRAYLGEKVGTTPAAMHSYFSALQPDAGQHLTAFAMIRQTRAALKETAHGRLPILAAVASGAAGGRAGPRNYLDLPAGPILRRHIAMLAPYPNLVWALRLSGAELWHWLEHSAAYFQTFAPGVPQADLIDPRFPAFNFDAIFGLRCEIDVGFPIGERIRSVTWEGRPLEDSQPFIVATTSYRAAGGGGFPGAEPANIVLRSQTTVAQAIEAELSAGPARRFDIEPWRITADLNAQAVLATGPGALQYFPEISNHAPEVLGSDAEGFLRLRVSLSP